MLMLSNYSFTQSGEDPRQAWSYLAQSMHFPPSYRLESWLYVLMWAWQS